jgi:hypothetical protein
MNITITNGTLTDKKFNAAKNYVAYDIIFTASNTNVTLNVEHAVSNRLSRIVRVFQISDGTNPTVPPVEVSGVNAVPFGTDYHKRTQITISGLTAGRVYKVEITLLNDDQG